MVLKPMPKASASEVEAVKKKLIEKYKPFFNKVPKFVRSPHPDEFNKYVGWEIWEKK